MQIVFSFHCCYWVHISSQASSNQFSFGGIIGCIPILFSGASSLNKADHTPPLGHFPGSVATVLIRPKWRQCLWLLSWFMWCMALALLHQALLYSGSNVSNHQATFPSHSPTIFPRIPLKSIPHIPSPISPSISMSSKIGP